MKTVIALLNARIQGELTAPTTSVPDCHIALLRMETQQLAVTGLRQLVADPKSAEAQAHAARLLKLIDEYTAKHSTEAPQENRPADVVERPTPASISQARQGGSRVADSPVGASTNPVSENIADDLV